MRISFWGYWLDPVMVAVSKEMYQLMRHFPGSCAFGVSSKYGIKLSFADRTFGVHTSLYPLARHAVPGVERWFDISHVYTTLADWHFLRALGTRPIVLTLTSPAQASDRRLLSKIAHVVAQSERLAASARDHGIPRDRVSIVYPGVDLQLFAPAPPPPTGGRWKCLFASSPETREEIHTKGVDLLLDLAAREPEFELTILWRPFGHESDRALEDVRKRGLPNVIIRRGRIPDIHRVYGDHHFTVAPFRTVGKSCPTSVLEGLACGRPTLLSQYVDVAGLLAREGAAISFDQNVDSLREAFHALRAEYGVLQRQSRLSAERHFDIRSTLGAYSTIYQGLLGERQPVARYVS
jgi:glycosyltransferase involved in cell wall biosynthesis